MTTSTFSSPRLATWITTLLILISIVAQHQVSTEPLPHSEHHHHHHHPSKRSTYRTRTRTNTRRTWWKWSSDTGYSSGVGNPPPSTPPATIRPVTSHSTPSSYSSYGSPSPGGNSHNSSNSTPTQPGSDARAWVDRHNMYRSTYGVPPVEWSNDLLPQAYHLLNTCYWKHTVDNAFGENMSAGQTSLQEVVDGWVHGSDESAAYDPHNPIYSHFTQVVWGSTQRIACAVKSCTTVQGSGLPQSPVLFWACEYDPPGNVIGEFAENVKAAKGGQPYHK